jgi:hypothetical protein
MSTLLTSCPTFVDVLLSAEVPMIPAADLQTVDALWRSASNNRFGYSVQKEMWVQVRAFLLLIWL